ncbi:uncharacterized protein THITE_115621 [Thermothielavioides terrestris NRRL 8126]|uniref:Secreted protein n=1 Tax=Thermothielavioides terrestris (strain ATCC 38088 / NRRL 8126) TaxID=578455 RepID=G2QX08_THETT|nr:uncharacterized protein THITE_115621 [Thermothielavioides terrestris NRRL 8126]AEO63974.1 hypothetical protein THITE_115621 [Thermothielavioides terrestris NRRL 8126]
MIRLLHVVFAQSPALLLHAQATFQSLWVLPRRDETREQVYKTQFSCKHQQQGALPHTFQILGTGLSDINSSGLCVHVFELVSVMVFFPFWQRKTRIPDATLEALGINKLLLVGNSLVNVKLKHGTVIPVEA